MSTCNRSENDKGLVMLKHVFVGVVLGWVALMLGCASAPPLSESEAALYGTQRSLLIDEYHIGVDDVVQVSVWKNPDLSIQVPVRPDGKISIPLVGEVLAGGETPEAVAAEITQRLSSFIRDPQVAVILTDLRSHEFLSRVRISGAVNSPASIPYRQGMTVLDVVLLAGGLNQYASGNGTKLYRQTESGLKTIPIAVSDIIKGGKMQSNIEMAPGDVLSVPERIF